MLPWLSPYANLDDYIIPGYLLVTDNREFSCGGDVGLFMKTEYNFHIRGDLRLKAHIHPKCIALRARQI